MASLPVDVVIFAPENFLPAEQGVEANTDGPIAGLTIFAYVDAASVTTTLSVAAIGGASVGGSGTDAVTISGSAKQINATLMAPDNVIYHGAHDFVGADTLTVMTNDGYGWPVGALTDTDQMVINVNSPSTGFAGDGHLTFAPPGALVTTTGFDYV